MGEVPINTLRNSVSPLSKRGRPRSTGPQTIVYCAVDGCISDLSQGREYHRRHRVCERHSKTPVVVIGGQEQRFCQQCSRFHSLGEFDDAKRSCRKRLDGHNRRRRKTRPDYIHMTHSGGFQTPITGSELLQFHFSDNWPVISEPEKALYGTDHLVPSSWSTACVKGDKRVVSDNQQTLFQSSPKVILSAGTKSSNLDTSSDRVSESGNSGCALSLLSTCLSHSAEICSMGPAIPPWATSSSAQVNRAALHLDYSLAQFSSSKGFEDDNSASFSSTSTTSNSHIFEGFYLGTDAFSETRPSRGFPFSW